MNGLLIPPAGILYNFKKFLRRYTNLFFLPFVASHFIRPSGDPSCNTPRSARPAC